MAYHYQQKAPEYELKETLGKGTFGVVQRCVETRSGREYAAKIINTKRMTRRDLENMEREAQICKMLKHQNIVQLHDSFHMRGMYIMIFDLITGGELFEDIVAREFYSEASAADCIRFVLSAMAYCHGSNVMHRDLKPENILLASKAKGAPVKIADFGLAIRVPDNRPRVYGLAGTFAYMAPEVIVNGPYNLSADIWSCGIILYLLLCGYPPFWDTDDTRLQHKILNGRHSFPPREWSMITADAKDLINRMLERNPDRRITAEDALNHQWLRKPIQIEKTPHLREAIIKLKQFNARRKMKGAVLTAMFALGNMARKREDKVDTKDDSNQMKQVSNAEEEQHERTASDIDYKDDNSRTKIDDGESRAEKHISGVKIINIDEQRLSMRQPHNGAMYPTTNGLHANNPPSLYHPDLSYLNRSSVKADGDWFFNEGLNEYHPRNSELMKPNYIQVRPVVNKVVAVRRQTHSIQVPMKSVLINRGRSLSIRRRQSRYN